MRRTLLLVCLFALVVGGVSAMLRFWDVDEDLRTPSVIPSAAEHSSAPHRPARSSEGSPSLASSDDGRETAPAGAVATDAKSEPVKPFVVSGRITDSITSTPLADAFVRLLRSDFLASHRASVDRQVFDVAERTVATVRTGKDGAFFLGAEKPGPFVVVVSADGFAPKCSDDFVMDTTQPRETIDLGLAPGVLLKGQVVELHDIPIPKARVAHLLANEQGFRFALTKRTDSQGRFQVAGPKESEFVLSAWKKGFARTLQTLSAHSDHEDIRVVLPAALRITGRVFDEATGKGLAGVRLRFLSHGAKTGRSVSWGQSGADGVYRVDGVSGDAKILVTARLQGYSIVTNADVGWGSRAFVVNARGKNFGDIVIDVPMRGGSSIRGHVLDAVSGAPVSGVLVTLRAGRVNSIGGDDVDIRSVQTTREGGFVFKGVPAGGFELIPWHPHYVLDAAQRPLVYEFTSTRTADAGRAAGVAGRLEPGEEREVQIRLVPAAEVTVHVTDEDGNPVETARLIGFEEGVKSDREFAMALRRLAPDSVERLGAGRYRLSGLPRSAKLMIQAAARGFPWTSSIEVDTRSATSEEVALTLERGIVWSGKVISPDGEPISEVRVRMALARGETDGLDGPTDPSQFRSGVLTGSVGQFRFIDIPARRFTVGVDGVKGMILRERDRFLDLSKGASKESYLHLEMPGTIEGRVVDAQGAPLQVGVRARVAITDSLFPDGRRRDIWVFTKKDGRFRFEGLDPSSKYTLRVVKRLEPDDADGPHAVEVPDVEVGTAGLRIVWQDTHR